MKALYCISCGIRTSRNFADEHEFNGIYCQRCAPKLTRKPPNIGSSVIKPKNKESLWQFILDNYKAGLYGEPGEPKAILRYWMESEAAGYPSANESVKYWEESIETTARWKGAGMGDYYCSLCQYTMSGRTKFCPECGAKMDEWEETEG